MKITLPSIWNTLPVINRKSLRRSLTIFMLGSLVSSISLASIAERGIVLLPLCSNSAHVYILDDIILGIVTDRDVIILDVTDPYDSIILYGNIFDRAVWVYPMFPSRLYITTQMIEVTYEEMDNL